MTKVYCVYCGDDAPDIESLSYNLCNKNPNSRNHVLYEGNPKNKYTCKYCGYTDLTISSLAYNLCDKSPSKHYIPSIN